MEAKNETEKIILEYFEKNASDSLKARVEQEKKTIAGALNYATEKARKHRTGNFACVADEVVFGWIMHYFEDEPASKYEAKSTGAKVSAPKKAEKKTAKKKPVTEKPVAEKPVETPAVVQTVAQSLSKKEAAERDAGQLFLFEGGAQ